MEIITGVERRRRWRLEEKLRIVAEVEEPGASFVAVARRHEVSRGLLWNWRRQVRRGDLTPEPMPVFVPVQVTPDPPLALPALDPVAVPGQVEDTRAEITLPDGTISRSTAKPSATAARASRSASTLADQVGACTAVLMPLFQRLQAHVMAAERLHGDDTTVPVLARGKTDIARLWTYVRDDRPFGGPAPSGAIFHYSRDRGGEHPQSHLAGYSGILQADAYGGYGKLYKPGRKPGPILEAVCWAHARRKFFVLADIAGSARRAAQGKAPAVLSPICLEAVQRIDALFDIERDINGHRAEERLTARQALSAPLLADLHRWLTEQRGKLARGNDVARAIDYLLKRWPAFARFLDDGRICISNNAAERALRGIALGRRSWLFCGSDRGGQRAAVMYSLIVTAKMNDVDPQAWIANVLARIAEHPAQRLDDLLPWNWAKAPVTPVPKAA